MGIFSHDDDMSEEDNEDDYLDIPESASLETARGQFEQMMGMPKDNQEIVEEEESYTALDEEERLSIRTKTLKKFIKESPPPLTAIMRERRLKEIELLSSLKTSDQGLNELWSLWFGERGPEAAEKLIHADDLMNVESWSEAEDFLLNLIDEHSMHWVEPVNRLATLYYMERRYEESKALCEIVLDSKPWHFGALSGIVLVCTAMNDVSGARYWTEQRLPPHGERRFSWVENAIKEAKKSLKKASIVGRDRSIGIEEVEFRKFRSTLEQTMKESTGDDESYDAWQ
jgi:hypothetical protein